MAAKVVVGVVVLAGWWLGCGAAAPPQAPLANAAPAVAEPASTASWEVACAAALDEASIALGRDDAVFRDLRATVLPPSDGVPRRARAGVAPTNPIARAAPAVMWSLQPLATAEHFYIDVLDVRDDRSGWEAAAGHDAWRCTSASAAQGHDSCVERRGDRLAVVRAIAGAPSPRVRRYFAVFQVAAERCLLF